MDPVSKFTRFYLRLLKALVQRHFIFILVGCALGILVFIYISSFENSHGGQVGKRTIAVIGEYTINTLPPEVVSLFAQGLTKIEKDGTPTPSLALSWKEEDKSQKFTFTVDQNVRWQDGKPVLAKDLRFQFKDVEISYPAANEIEFKLQDSYAPFLSTVSRPIFKINKPKNKFLAFILWILKKDLPIGTGPYQITDIAAKNQNIARIDLKPLSKQLPSVSFRFYSTEDTAITAFKLGEVKEIFDLSSPHALTDWPNIVGSGKSRDDRYVAVFFNTQKDPFSNKNLRQALSYAINKNIFPNRAIGPLNPNSWAYNNQVKPYDQELTKTRSLLKQANFDKDLNIEISTFPWLLKQAEVIKNQWETAGIKATVKVINSIPDDFDVLLEVQAIPVDPDQYNLWHSTQQTNLTRLKSPKIDKLLEDGRKTGDHNTRQKIYLDFQRFLVEESPAIFLFHPISYSISRY